MELTAFIIIGVIMVIYFAFFKNKDTGSNESELKDLPKGHSSFIVEKDL
jgi:hypothetical protein